MPDYKCLIYEVKDAVATLTLNRPERLNALGDTLRDDLYDAVLRASQDTEVRVLVVTGAGKGFCAGGDVKAMNDTREGRAPARPLEDKVVRLRAGGVDAGRLRAGAEDRFGPAGRHPTGQACALSQRGDRSPRGARVRDIRAERLLRDRGRPRRDSRLRREARAVVQGSLTDS